jgi:protein SCO1/2
LALAVLTVIPAQAEVQLAVTPAQAGVQSAVTPAQAGVQLAVTPAQAGVQSAVTPAQAGVQVSDLKSGAFDPPRIAPELNLVGSDGKPLQIEHYRGKVVALGFGYTHCPEICPTTLSRLAKARESLGAAARDLQVIYVTVDPDRDDAKRLHQFLSSFDTTFIGGTGTAAQLDKVYREYGVTAVKHPGSAPGVYGMEHSSFVYLIDRQGRLRAMVPYGEPPEDVAHDAAVLLKQ